MIRGIKFELKKYVLTRQTLSTMFVLTFAGAALLFLLNLTSIFEESRQIRLDFFDMVGDSFTEEDRQRFMKEKEEVCRELGLSETNIFPDENRMWQKGKYTDSKWYDYVYLSAAINCIECIDQRNSIIENALKDSNVFTSDYYKEDIHALADRENLLDTVRDMVFGWFSCIAVIIIFSSSFSDEYTNNIYNVLCLTKKGCQNLTLIKILSALLVSIAVNLYFWGIYLIGENLIRGGISLSDWNKPLFLANGFIMCASGKTVGDMLVTQIALSILVSVLAAMFALVLSRTIKKGLYCLMTALVSFVVVLIPNILEIAFGKIRYLTHHPELFPISEPEFYKLMEMEKTFNPFSLMNYRYYAVQPQYVRIFDSYYPLQTIPVVIAIVLIGILCCVLLGGKRKGL